MKELDYNQFELRLEKITREIFSSFTKKIKAVDVCGFALYSDESASSILASLNTCAHLKKKYKKYPNDKEAFRWTPAEWSHEGVENDDINELSRELFDVSSHIKENAELEKFRNNIFDSAVGVLTKLRSEGLFDSTSDDFILLFAISDYSHPEQEIKWAKMLNPPEKSQEFEEWRSKTS